MSIKLPFFAALFFIQISFGQRIGIGLETVSQRTSLPFNQLYSDSVGHSKYTFSYAMLKSVNLSPFISYTFQNKAEVKIGYTWLMSPVLRLGTTFNLSGVSYGPAYFDQQQIRLSYNQPLLGFRGLRIRLNTVLAYTYSNLSGRQESVKNGEYIFHPNHDQTALTDMRVLKERLSTKFSSIHLLDLQNYFSVHLGVNLFFKNFHFQMNYGTTPYKPNPNSLFKYLQFYGINCGYTYHLKLNNPAAEEREGDKAFRFKNLLAMRGRVDNTYLKFGIPIYAHTEFLKPGLYDANTSIEYYEQANYFGYQEYTGNYPHYELNRFERIKRIRSGPEIGIGYQKNLKHRWSVQGEVSVSFFNIEFVGTEIEIKTLKGNEEYGWMVTIDSINSSSFTTRYSFLGQFNFNFINRAYLSVDLTTALALHAYNGFRGVEFPGPNRLQPAAQFGLRFNQALAAIELAYIMNFKNLSEFNGVVYLTKLNRIQLNIIVPIHKKRGYGR